MTWTLRSQRQRTTAWLRSIRRSRSTRGRTRERKSSTCATPMASRSNSSGNSAMAEKRVGIIMHGVTGRMGMNQHLVRSILEIRNQGGVALKDGTRLMPDPILIGRNAQKVEELARKYGVERWSTDLAQALQNPND